MRHRTRYNTFCQFFELDIVEPLDFLHDQLLLVDLDDERGIPFVSREPELANGVLQFLGDVHGVRLGKVRARKSASAKGGERRTNHGERGQDAIR